MLAPALWCNLGGRYRPISDDRRTQLSDSNKPESGLKVNHFLSSAITKLIAVFYVVLDFIALFQVHGHDANAFVGIVHELRHQPILELNRVWDVYPLCKRIIVDSMVFDAK